MHSIIFCHPEPASDKARILPVFLPFAGCRKRCLYCAQPAQTGHAEEPLEQALNNLHHQLTDIFEPAKIIKKQNTGCRNNRPLPDRHHKPPYEVAFYGGTFTALPLVWQHAFLNAVLPYKNAGFVSRIRCSTKPDAVSGQLLSDLKQHGLDMVELGIQSFNNSVLSLSLRGYNDATAEEACTTVHNAGLKLGIQLLPGLPEMDVATFLSDVRRSISLSPDIVRLYPCLVVEGTGLARLYKDGRYTPWSLQETVDALTEAVAMLWQHNIPVIRMGVAQEAGFDSAILAGPRHNALGNMIKANVLLRTVRKATADLGRPPVTLLAPRSCQGEFFGHKKQLAPEYAALGLPSDAIRWWNLPVFCLW